MVKLCKTVSNRFQLVKLVESDCPNLNCILDLAKAKRAYSVLPNELKVDSS